MRSIMLRYILLHQSYDQFHEQRPAIPWGHMLKRPYQKLTDSSFQGWHSFGTWDRVKKGKHDSDLVTNKVASQAIPTSVPDGHPLIKCQRPAPSWPFCPLHCEKIERRSSSAALEHGIFQGNVGSGWEGHLRMTVSPIIENGMNRYSRCRLDLKFDDTQTNVECALHLTRISIHITDRQKKANLIKCTCGVPICENCFACIILRSIFCDVLAVCGNSHVDLFRVNNSNSKHRRDWPLSDFGDIQSNHLCFWRNWWNCQSNETPAFASHTLCPFRYHQPRHRHGRTTHCRRG